MSIWRKFVTGIGLTIAIAACSDSEISTTGSNQSTVSIAQQTDSTGTASTSSSTEPEAPTSAVPRTTRPLDHEDLVSQQFDRVINRFEDHPLYGGIYQSLEDSDLMVILVVGPSSEADAFQEELRSIVDPVVSIEFRDTAHSFAALLAETEFISPGITEVIDKWSASGSWGPNEIDGVIDVGLSSQEAIDEHRATGPRNDLSIEIRYELMDDIVLGDG